MKKTFNKILIIIFWIGALLLPFFTSLGVKEVTNNINYNNFNYQQKPNNLAAKDKQIATIHTSSIDWSGFNKIAKQLPTWQGTSSKSLTSTKGYYHYLVALDSNIPDFPDGPNFDTDVWNYFYFYNDIGSNNSTNHVVRANDWFPYMPFDWEDPEASLQIAHMIITASGDTYFSPLDAAHPDLPEMTYTIEPGVITTQTLSYQAPILNSSQISINENDDFNITFDFAYNDGPGHVMVKANDIEIYNIDLTASGITTFSYAPPLNYADYKFDFYLNDTLIPSLTKTIKSSFQVATVENLAAYQVKANYQPTVKSIIENGIAGASLTLNNPSEIEVKKIQFILKDQNDAILGYKNATISASDINTYDASFDDIGLIAGEYKIDYEITFNTDTSKGPFQDPLVGNVGALTLATILIDIPQLDFNSLEVVNHPTFEENISNWDNGQVTVNYSLNKIDEANNIQDATYHLYQVGQEKPIASGSLLNQTNLSFMNLKAGTYYIKWEFSWNILGEIGLLLQNGQTENVTLVEKEQDKPIISSNSISTTKYYNSHHKAFANGVIVFDDYGDLIGKKVKITPTSNGQSEPSKTFTIFSYGVININRWELATHGEYTFEVEVLSYQVNSKQATYDYPVGTTNPFAVTVYHRPFIDNTSIILDDNKNIALNFDFTLNDGPGQVVIKVNDITWYQQNLQHDSKETIIFTPPLEYSDYTFDFYLNGLLISELSQSIKSAFQLASIVDAQAYEIKADYQPSSGSISHNGVVGASVTLANPSNVIVESINFILKDNNGITIATKAGIKAPNNTNTYTAAFDENALASGNYQISYEIVFNNNPLIGPSQEIITNTMEIFLATSLVSDPQVDFNALEVENHPSFITDAANWDNGVVKVHYDINMITDFNVFESATYTLYREGVSDPVTSGSLLNGHNVLTFTDLQTGYYYLVWTLNYTVNGESMELLNRQTSSVFLQDINLKQPQISMVNFEPTFYYSNAHPGAINGQIVLNNYEDAINKELKITPIINGEAEESRIFNIPISGIIDLADWNLKAKGAYVLKLEIINYQINSMQNEADYLIGKSPTFNIEQHNFEAPIVNTIANRSSDGSKLTLNLISEETNSPQPWLDVDHFQMKLEINYFGGTKQIIVFDETWNNGLWNTHFGQAIFEFQLDYVTEIENVVLEGQFTNSYMPDSHHDLKVMRAVDNVTVEIENDWEDIINNPIVIAALVGVTILIGLYAIGLPIIYQIIKNKTPKP